VSPCEPGTSRVVAGLIVMIVGLALLADRLDAAVRFPGHFWPLILVVMGAARLADSATSAQGRRNIRSGAWLLFIGLWGLINEFHVFHFDYGSSWPLLVIGAGVGIVWRALDSPRPRANRQEQ
jgi:cell wall-active antibiotic response 4TMS protein YvqF